MSEQFRRRIEERGQTLRSKSPAELLELQNCPTETVKIDGQTGTIDLIVEEERGGSLRIVIQGFLDTKRLPRLGVKHVELDGFRVDAHGELSELREEEFYEFD